MVLLFANYVCIYSAEGFLLIHDRCLKNPNYIGSFFVPLWCPKRRANSEIRITFLK